MQRLVVDLATAVAANRSHLQRLEQQVKDMSVKASSQQPSPVMSLFLLNSKVRRCQDCMCSTGVLVLVSCGVLLCLWRNSRAHLR